MRVRRETSESNGVHARVISSGGCFACCVRSSERLTRRGVDGTHNPEFTTCEFYEAHADMYKLLDTTEELLRGIVREVTGKEQVTITRNGVEEVIDFSKPFRRISIVPGLEEALGAKLPDVNSFGASPRRRHACLLLTPRRQTQCRVCWRSSAPPS